MHLGAVLRIVWPAISIAAFDSELAALLAVCTAPAPLFLDLGVMTAAKRAQVIEPIMRTQMRHWWPRLDVIRNDAVRTTACDGATIAVSSETGITKRAPLWRLIERV
jgi:hypothetical protein